MWQLLHIHRHISSATNNDGLKFWYIRRRNGLFILNIFIDCIKVGHYISIDCKIKLKFSKPNRWVQTTKKKRVKRTINGSVSNQMVRVCVCFGMSVYVCVSDDVVSFFFSLILRPLLLSSFDEFTFARWQNAWSAIWFNAVLKSTTNRFFSLLYHFCSARRIFSSPMKLR